MDLTRLLGKLGATVQFILPAKLQIRNVQRLQINPLKLSVKYQAKLQYLQHLWIRNLTLCNGKSLILPSADLLMTMDASTKRLGTSCQSVSTRSP